MSVDEEIFEHLQDLPQSARSEVLDFIEFLNKKETNREDREWSKRSLESAMRGLVHQDDPEYTTDDIIERI